MRKPVSMFDERNFRVGKGGDCVQGCFCLSRRRNGCKNKKKQKRTPGWNGFVKLLSKHHTMSFWKSNPSYNLDPAKKHQLLNAAPLETSGPPTPPLNPPSSAVPTAGGKTGLARYNPIPFFGKHKAGGPHGLTSLNNSRGSVCYKPKSGSNKNPGVSHII